MLRTIFYKGVRLVSVIIGGLGFASTLTGDSVLAISPERGWVVGIVAFGVFFIVTLAREVDLELQQKPNIVVVPEISSECAKLVVRNIGGAGKFSARAKVEGSHPETGLYTMNWESVNDISCHIDGNGGTASIVVGKEAKESRLGGDADTAIFKGSLILSKMGESGVEEFPVISGKIRHVTGVKEYSEHTYVERCIVQVTITATPTLKKKWGTRKYLCEIEKGQIKLCETELSDPNVHIYE